jgi:hypothetical protein
MTHIDPVVAYRLVHTCLLGLCTLPLSLKPFQPLAVITVASGIATVWFTRPIVQVLAVAGTCILIRHIYFEKDKVTREVRLRQKFAGRPLPDKID